jgi:hypothetical protein
MTADSPKPTITEQLQEMEDELHYLRWMYEHIQESMGCASDDVVSILNDNYCDHFEITVPEGYA